MNVLDCLEYGEANSKSREELCIATGLSDRSLRKQIETLRKEHCICSNSENRGYFLPKTDEEVNHFVREQVKRGVKLIQMAKRFKLNCEQREQESLI